MLSEKISAALLHIKKTAGFKTQEEVALAVGISPTRLKNMVTGRVKKLSTDEALAFQHRYGIRVAWWSNAEAPMLLTKEELAVAPVLNELRMATEETVKLGLDDRQARVVSELLMNVRRGDGKSVERQLNQLSAGGSSAHAQLHSQAERFEQGVREGRYQAPDELVQKFVFVPRHKVTASAGHGAVITDETVVDYLAFRRDWVRQSLNVDPLHLALIDARGDSMSPTIESGDLLLLDTREGNTRSEGIYVINLSGSLLVKRLRIKISGTVEVISDNPRYGTEALSGDELERLIMVGRVVWHGRKI